MAFDWFRRQYDQKAKEAQKAEPEPTPAEPEAKEAAAEEIAEDYLNWAKTAYKTIQKRQQDEHQPVTSEVPVPTAVEPTLTDAIAIAPETVETPAEVAIPAESETVEAPVEVAIPAEPETIEASVEASVEVSIPEELETLEVPVPEDITLVTDAAIAEPAAIEVVTEPPIAPESVAPESVAPEAITLEAITPESVAPESVAPESVALEAITPEAIIPESVAPEPVAPLPFWAQAEAERQARLELLRQTAIADATPVPEVPVLAVETPDAIAVEAAPTTDQDDQGLVFDEGFLWSAEILAAQGRRPEDISPEEITWLKRLRQGLDKTRRGLINQLRLIVGQGPLTQDAILEIESVLLQADVGVAATDAIIDALQKRLLSQTLPPDAAITYLKQILRDMLDKPLQATQNTIFAPQKDTLNIWLMTGVNGAGKTTTIGKLAHIARKSDYRCLIAAADTFRAAAVQQVKVWGGRSGVEVIANPGQNTDPAAVVFDAIAAAQSRGTELLLVDTAGRLQNKKNLMDELSKIRRIIDKKAAGATVESLLVLDATLGQNGLRQAEVFSQAAQLSGVVLTKLDGTAKGGIALAVVQQLGLPIRFIGAGEGIEDLRPFSSYEFVEALLNG
jgi:fused signal recognition particle receptor